MNRKGLGNREFFGHAATLCHHVVQGVAHHGC